MGKKYIDGGNDFILNIIIPNVRAPFSPQELQKLSFLIEIPLGLWLT